MSTSVSQYGITVTWTADLTVGQFCTGDYYVVAPSGITVTSITPASEADGTGRMLNGAMVNPTAGQGVSQGFDSRASLYSAALNAARPGGSSLSVGNPLVIATNSSLMCCVSNPTPPSTQNKSWILDGMVLTVLASAPSAGDFRPPYCGSDKTILGNINTLDYSDFSAKAPVAATPSAATLATYMVRPWFEVVTNYQGREIHPSNNQPDYGRDMAELTGPIGLFLNLSYTDAEKESVAMGIVQYGIDVYGALLNGGNWGADGGHNQGRKMPMIVAGYLLGNSTILGHADDNLFQEDKQVFTVGAAQMLVTPESGGSNFPRAPYGGGSLTAPYTSPWTSVVTISQASPAVVSWTSHFLERWVPVYFTTTGTLPSPLVANTTYWVCADGLTADAFQIATVGRIAQGPIPSSIVTTTAGSGVHTCHYAMLGLADWGEKQQTQPARAGANMDAAYRGINIVPWLAHCLTVRLITGGISTWNNSIYFDYNDRMHESNNTAIYPVFANQMWTAYRNPSTDPTLISAEINTAGTTVTFTFNVSVSFGAGGNGGMTIVMSGGAATLTYASGAASTALVYNVSRTVINGESALATYVQPGNGIESTSGTVDLESFADILVLNNSTQQQAAAMSNGSRQRLFPSTGGGF